MEQKNIVGKVLIKKLGDLALIATDLKSKIENSKTSLKKDYYQRKLKKNNEKAMELILGLAKINKSKETLPEEIPDNLEKNNG